MDKEFKLDIRKIKKKKEITYFVCLTYIGQDDNLKNEIERIKEDTFFYEDMKVEIPAYRTDDLCLFNMNLKVNSLDKIEGNFYFGEFEDEKAPDLLRYEINSNCHLFSFYNKAIQYNLQKFDAIKRLKGIGHMLLCVVLGDIISSDILSKDNFITLEASGEIEGKGMEGLVKYYEALGFKQVYPQLFDIGISQTNIPMKATLGEIIGNCNYSNMSQDVQQLYKTIQIRNL